MMRRIASTGGDWAPRCRRRLGGGAEARCPGPSPPRPGRGRRRASSEKVSITENSESIRRFMCHQMSITLRDQHVNTAVCAGHALFYHRVLSTDVTTTSDGGTHATYRIGYTYTRLGAGQGPSHHTHTKSQIPTFKCGTIHALIAKVVPRCRAGNRALTRADACRHSPWPPSFRCESHGHRR